MLIAIVHPLRPQNTAEDIAGLCKTTQISRLLHHPSMETAAKNAATASQGSLSISSTLVYSVQHHEVPEDCTKARSGLSPEEESETDCIIFHSSGSSGTPKVSLGFPNPNVYLTRLLLVSRFLKNIVFGQKQLAASLTLPLSPLHLYSMAVSVISSAQ